MLTLAGKVFPVALRDLCRMFEKHVRSTTNRGVSPFMFFFGEDFARSFSFSFSLSSLLLALAFAVSPASVVDGAVSGGSY